MLAYALVDWRLPCSEQTIELFSTREEAEAQLRDLLDDESWDEYLEVVPVELPSPETHDSSPAAPRARIPLSPGV